MLGFEKDQNSLGETQQTHMLGNRRLCSRMGSHRSSTLMDAIGSFGFFTTRKPKVLHLLQQTLRHNRASSMNVLSLHNPTVVDQSRTADEDVGEDERDDEMSEPTLMTSAEKRKADETAKELRASLPTADSSHASSLHPDDEAQDQFVRSSTQARTTKTRVEGMKFFM